jgi:hypothetical protein
LTLQKNKNSVDRILKIRYGVERRWSTPITSSWRTLWEEMGLFGVFTDGGILRSGRPTAAFVQIYGAGN